MDKEKETSVQVAIRIRPQNAREQVDLCRVCTFVTPGEPQVVLGKDKAFTYDFVYNVGSEQQEIYKGCIEKLVEGCFHGLNATVLAYGQTGSGKTYTMGTGFDVTTLPEEQGMIPRAVHHLFTGIANRLEEARSNGSPPPKFSVSAQFLELYNEEIIDLFDTARDSSKRLRIHETPEGGIYVDGAISQHVQTEAETMEALKRGAVSRTVGSTNMNAQSSRSHAIFTILLKQERPIMNADTAAAAGEGRETSNDFESLSAKFHFVDLAGSERLKRTGATGDRAKEGISINCGLLALGNVISALGDHSKKGSHVPYRDSKLTRLLQDSLGGNSRTLMIACISPSDRDFMETLNTLKYSNRARNIKNKVSVNQDKASAQLAALRKQISELENELVEFRAGRLVVSNDGSVVINDLANENTMLKTENDKLRLRIKSMQGLVDLQNEKIAMLQAERDFKALQHHDESTGQVMIMEDGGEGEQGGGHVQELLQQYLHQIQELRGQLMLSESSKENIRPAGTGSGSSLYRAQFSTPLASHSSSSLNTNAHQPVPVEMETEQVLKIAKKNIDKLNRECSQKRVTRRPRSLRRKRKDYTRSTTHSIERMSSEDVEEWVLKCTSESDVMITEGEGSDTEINEEEEERVEFEDIEDSSRGDDLDVNSSMSSPETDEDDSSAMEDEEEEDELLDDNRSIATSIAELSTEINIKQQLVDQLEKAQKSLNSLRSQYEEKMMILQNQIKATETERDKFIKEITSRQSEHEEAVVKEMKEKYEKQLRNMRAELKQLQIAKREHARALQKNAQQFAELQKLNNDLVEMKKQKFKLMRQLKEEASVMKKKDQKREKELAQLRRDHKRKENIIKTLQADAKRKEIIIRKRNEEVTALRKLQQQQASSAATASEQKVTLRRPKSSSASLSKEDEPAAKKARLLERKSSMFSSESARKKWKAMEKKVKEIVSRGQMMNGFESEMDQWMVKREQLSQRADQLKKQREDLLQATEDKDILLAIDEELEALTAQISWANDCIEKLQDEVCDYEDAKAEINTTDTTALIHTCSTREAKFILENLVNLAIETNILCHQKEAEVKSLQLRLATSEQHAELIKMYSSPHAPLSPLVVNSRTVSKIASTTLQPHPFHRPPTINLLDELSNENNTQATDSLDVTYTVDNSPDMEISPPTAPPTVLPKLFKLDESSSKLRRRTGLPNELAFHRRQMSDPPPIVSDQQSSTNDEALDYEDGSVKLRKNTIDSSANICSPRRRLSNKKKSASQSCIGDSLEVPSPGECPGSPRSNRLGEGARTTDNTEISKGHIETERPFTSRSGKLFTCTHTAKGHTGGILSLCCSDSMFFSASQDCTVKVWDLDTGKETAALTRHHSYVRKVIYDAGSHLVFTACQSVIKLWDLRDLREPQFVKTLMSGSIGQGPAHLSSADTVVQDMVVSGDVLFSASGNVVNVWDLKQMSTIGRLVGHTGTVGTITNISGGYVATGSRDRLIKLYDVSDVCDSDNGFNRISQATLAPAHYDTVSSLAAHEDMMFSACGVSIKQWDIPKRTVIQAIDGAHLQTKNNSITSLTHFPSTLLLASACKAGILKLWQANECQPLGEVIAHKSPINCIDATNDQLLFSGSSDKTIKIWRPNLSSLPAI